MRHRFFYLWAVLCSLLALTVGQAQTARAPQLRFKNDPRPISEKNIIQAIFADLPPRLQDLQEILSKTEHPAYADLLQSFFAGVMVSLFEGAERLSVLAEDHLEDKSTSKKAPYYRDPRNRIVRLVNRMWEGIDFRSNLSSSSRQDNPEDDLFITKYLQRVEDQSLNSRFAARWGQFYLKRIDSYRRVFMTSWNGVVDPIRENAFFKFYTNTNTDNALRKLRAELGDQVKIFDRLKELNFFSSLQELANLVQETNVEKYNEQLNELLQDDHETLLNIRRGLYYVIELFNYQMRQQQQELIDQLFQKCKETDTDLVGFLEYLLHLENKGSFGRPDLENITLAVFLPLNLAAQYLPELDLRCFTQFSGNLYRRLSEKEQKEFDRVMTKAIGDSGRI